MCVCVCVCVCLCVCFVDRASGYNRVKKTQLYALLILRIFRQPLRISGVSRPIIRRYNCLLSWLDNQDNRHLSKKNNKYQLLYTYGCAVPPDDGPGYARYI